MAGFIVALIAIPLCATGATQDRYRRKDRKRALRADAMEP